jgi:L-ascorbate metabolism protein UlaG (beta-lactamase superfamily)
MSVTITYNGHSCFTVSAAGYSIVFDPYSPGSVPGLKPLELTAAAVLCSHGHGDHGYAAAVKTSGRALPFALEKIACPHDDAGGAKRGMNTIHILTMGALRLAHMGDIGCALPEADMARLRGVDVLLLPVGGYYTIDAMQANALADEIGARVAIPMHYRTASSGFPVIARLEDFLALRGDVQHFGDTLIVDEDTPRCTAVLKQRFLA